MKVSIKKFDVEMEVRNNGIELEVYDNKDNFRGDLIVTKSKLIWCKGKTSRKNGKTIELPDFIDYMETL